MFIDKRVAPLVCIIISIAVWLLLGFGVVSYLPDVAVRTQLLINNEVVSRGDAAEVSACAMSRLFKCGTDRRPVITCDYRKMKGNFPDCKPLNTGSIFSCELTIGRNGERYFSSRIGHHREWVVSVRQHPGGFIAIKEHLGDHALFVRAVSFDEWMTIADCLS